MKLHTIDIKFAQECPSCNAKIKNIKGIEIESDKEKKVISIYNCPKCNMLLWLVADQVQKKKGESNEKQNAK